MGYGVPCPECGCNRYKVLRGKYDKDRPDRILRPVKCDNCGLEYYHEITAWMGDGKLD